MRAENNAQSPARLHSVFIIQLSRLAVDVQVIYWLAIIIFLFANSEGVDLVRKKVRKDTLLVIILTE